MAASFKKDDGSISEIAQNLIKQYYPHLNGGKVRIDYIFAYGERDDTGKVSKPALMAHGMPADGICRKIPLLDRTKGMGDAEIKIDGDWWDAKEAEEKAALVDHELYHIMVTDKKDPLGRPLLKLRKHDFQFGWFTEIANRHGKASGEQRQAALIMESSGQYYFPEIHAALKSDGRFKNLEHAELRVIETKDGRKITPAEMVEEAKDSLAKQRAKGV